jgi:hypothetical protein
VHQVLEDHTTCQQCGQMWTSSDPCVNQNAGCPVASFIEIAQKLQDSSDREVATAAARALAGVVVAAHGAADLEARRG